MNWCNYNLLRLYIRLSCHNILNLGTVCIRKLLCIYNNICTIFPQTYYCL